MHYPTRLGTGLLCLGWVMTANALETDYGEFNANLRLRYETVEQDNPLKDASATTLRAQIGFTSQPLRDFSFGVQAEAVTALGPEDYNSGPGGNGNTAYSVIPDPEGQEINQLWLAYDGLPNTSLKFGRQRLIYDNARFVGNVGWRQNEQTFDGLTFINRSLPRTVVSLAHLKQVNSIFFQDIELDAANLLNLRYEYRPGSSFGAYAYDLDYEGISGADRRTLGIRNEASIYQTESVSARYRLEYAQQVDVADSPAEIDLDYSVVELALKWDLLEFRVAQETLEGDGVNGFLTPLATLHAFNGWADQFLSTPAAGLVDRYAVIGARAGPGKWLLAYHDFKAQLGSTHYGNEWNASLGFSPAKGYSVVLKWAEFDAAETGLDTTKWWVQLAYRL